MHINGHLIKVLIRIKAAGHVLICKKLINSLKVTDYVKCKVTGVSASLMFFNKGIRNDCFLWYFSIVIDYWQAIQNTMND
jgi:hypothetical protein